MRSLCTILLVLIVGAMTHLVYIATDILTASLVVLITAPLILTEVFEILEEREEKRDNGKEQDA